MVDSQPIPPPPSPDSIGGGGPAEDVLNDFRKRISDLEALKDLKSLSAEAEYKELLKNEIQQRIQIKMIVIVIAIVVLIFMGGVLTHASHTFSAKDITKIPSTLLIVMFLAPIVSISTVTVMLLFGAFRQFKDDDLNKVNISSLAGEIAKASTGGN